MLRLSSLALIALCLVPKNASAVDIKNIRPSYGPLGAPRPTNKFVAGDYLFITYDIEGLKIDPKTFKASYKTTLELIDGNGQVPFKKPNNNEVAPSLGGARMPGDLILFLESTKPGKYKVRLTVDDNLAKSSKSFEYPFEVIPTEFTFVGISAKSVGFVGENYLANFALVGTTLDGKMQPSVDIEMRVFEPTGKNLVTLPIKNSFPKDLPDDIDLGKANFVPMQFPIYLNRSGNFIVEVLATDKLSKKQTQLKYNLTVLDNAGK